MFTDASDDADGGTMTVPFADAGDDATRPTGGEASCVAEPKFPASDAGTCDPRCSGTCRNGHCITKLYAGPVTPSGGEMAFGIAVDAVNVYWSDYDGKVMKIPTDGGDATPIMSGLNSIAAPIAIDGSYIYAIDTYKVLKAPLSGGPATTLLSSLPGSSANVALDAQNIYWTAANWTADAITGAPIWGPGNVLKVAKKGGSLTTLASSPDWAPENIVVVGDTVYWIATDHAMTPPVDELFMVPVAGGVPVVLASSHTSPNFSDMGALGSDGQLLYLGASGGSRNTVSSIPLKGGTATTIACSIARLTGVSSLITDGTDIYWMSDDTMKRMGLSDRKPEEVAATEGVIHFALDATSLYWADDDSGGINKMTPR